MSIQNEIAEGTEASDVVELDVEVDKPLSEVWGSLTQPAGVQALFGEGVALGDKGDAWQATDGTCGVTRSYHPGEQIRISWHSERDAPPTVVDVTFSEAANVTRVLLRHENLPQDADRAALRTRWQEGIARLAAL